jgi:hypothetical protein
MPSIKDTFYIQKHKWVEVKGWQRIHCAKSNQKKARLAISVFEKVDSKKTMKLEKKKRYLY